MPPPISPTRPGRALFLEPASYRQRRLMDAARLLPVFSLALLMVPVFWSGGHPTGSAMLYLFGVWFLTILATAVLSWRLTARLGGSDQDA